MTEPPRNWDKELADIDKVIARQPAPAEPPARLPPGTPPGVAPTERVAPPPGLPPAMPRRAVARTWFLTALGVLLAVALPLWPYAKACGMQLAFYLGAVGLTLLVGIWSATNSWRARRGIAHFLALLTVAWAAVLLAGAVLPRVGYAKVGQTWLCP